MSKTYNIGPIQQALETAKTVLVLLPQNPSLDAVAAGLALYLSLSKKQLNLTVGCATPMTVNFNRLFAVDKIRQHIGNQNLIISFDFPADSIEKISFDRDQSQKLYLTVEPKAGATPPDPQSVKYSYTGSDGDLIFVIGARSLEDLGSLYQEEKQLLDNKEKTLVNLSHLDKNTQFGTVNLYDPTASGCSQITTAVLLALNLPFDADIATNLLAGIEANSANFSASNVTAATFEMVAFLMKQGAKKGYITAAPRPQASFTQPTPFSAATFTPPSSTATPSPDWLKPKVLKSSTTKI
jgi:nanoRNase/pAp phosphatase (c-di-AMP/oligoRNAs hydrolase)